MIGEPSLAGKTIMVVEDEFLIADYMQNCLEEAGARIVGPFGRRREAEQALDGGQAIDVAILDINLGGDLVYPLADALAEASIRFIFTTGYNDRAIPPRFCAVPRLIKPVDMRQLALILAS